MPSDPAPDGTTRVPRAEVRDRILSAAALLFAERGVHATTLDEVAAIAGFSKGAVYSNFTSKDDLVAQLMTARVDEVLGSMVARLGPAIDAGGLPDVVRQVFSTFAEPRRFDLLVEFRTWARHHPEVMPVFVAQRRAFQDGTAALVQRWYAGRPELEAVLPAATLATVLVGTVVGVAFDGPALPDAAVGEVLAQLLEALAPPAPTA